MFGRRIVWQAPNLRLPEIAQAMFSKLGNFPFCQSYQLLFPHFSDRAARRVLASSLQSLASGSVSRILLGGALQTSLQTLILFRTFQPGLARHVCRATCSRWPLVVSTLFRTFQPGLARHVLPSNLQSLASSGVNQIFRPACKHDLVSHFSARACKACVAELPAVVGL